MFKSAEFSIIVPFFRCDVNRFENTLAATLRHLPANGQVIVVHDGSYQNPHQLDEVDFAQVAQGSNLGTMFSAGLRLSDAEFVGLLRPGVELDENWHLAIRESFASPMVASVCPAIVDESKTSRLVTAGIQTNARLARQFVGKGVRLGRKADRLAPVGPSSWAAFYRRSSLDQLGTHDSELNSVYLDVDIAMGLAKLGFQSALQQDCVITVEDPTSLFNELSLPHGEAVARAKVRFGFDTKLTGSLYELLSLPFKPWLFRHVVGKLKGKAMRDVDEAHYRRLVSKSQELRNRSTIAIPEQETSRRAA